MARSKDGLPQILFFGVSFDLFVFFLGWRFDMEHFW